VKKFLSENINGILGTVIIHLAIILGFLFFKIGEVKEQQHDQMLIELIEDIQSVEEIIKQVSEPVDIPLLDPQTIHNIAVNTAEKIQEEISTEKYEQQVMDELGIESLKPENKLNPSENEPVVQQEVKKHEKPKEIRNIIYKANATIQYNLTNRWHVADIYVPTYKCQEGGTVVLQFSVDQKGFVINVSFNDAESTKDQCLRNEAYGSILKARFNNDPSSPTKQQGTITYVFFPQ
jgi:outer membrane biosynthesis protein TonB